MHVYGLFNLDVEIVCRQNNVERECTKIDFELSEKYKHYLCRTNGGKKKLFLSGGYELFDEIFPLNKLSVF